MGFISRSNDRISWTLVVSLVLTAFLFSCGGSDGGVVNTAHNASGTWTLTATKTYDSENPNSVGEVEQSEITINQSSNNFNIVTDSDDVLSGTIDGSIYEFNGIIDSANINGTFELTSETSLKGDYSIFWTDGVNEHTEMWDFTGTKISSPSSGSCGEGLPLVISDLNFPNTVVSGSNYDGTVAYQGSFEAVSNPLMMGRIPFSGGTITFINYSPPTTQNCVLTFSARIPDDLAGTGPIYFKLVDFDEEIDFVDNWEDSAVSNELSQSITFE